MVKRDTKVRGVLRLKKGFGFLIPEGKDADKYEGDFFVPPGNVGDAMDGDLVLARVDSSRGDDVVVIIKVIERASDVIVGTIDVRGRQLYFICQQATEPMIIEVKFIRKDQKNRPPEYEPGMKALAKIIEYPDGQRAGKVILKEVLGPAGDPDVELRAGRYSYQIPGAFPDEVIQAAAKLSETIPPNEIEKRRDLRKMGVFTIDPEDARDFDDAVSVEIKDDGNVLYTIGIHIADVSHYIKEHGAIDTEAYNRGNSTYLPGEVIPMLPERLSNRICSLVEGEDRLTVSVFADFSHDLEPIGYSLTRSVICSKRRFTYDEVDEVLATGTGDFAGEIKILESIGRSLNKMRVQREAIDFDLPENKPILNHEGKVIEIKTVERTWSHRLIEELMIMANEYT
ncbi:MAG: RNB domain-containing ribonuclease, partial [Candidatus Lindowbacteria bacterium]|nr:RNB domain-containing ribonuclease [Candidatus Lindowbacteria bacterium]